MKKIKLFFLGIFIAIGTLVYAGYINYANTGMTNFIYIDVSGAEGFDCVLRRGTTVEVKGAFTAPLVIDELKLDCYFEIQGEKIPVILPAQPAFNLPASIGDKVTFYLKVDILRSYPTIQGTFHLKVRDRYHNEVAGAKFLIRVV